MTQSDRPEADIRCEPERRDHFLEVTIKDVCSWEVGQVATLNKRLAQLTWLFISERDTQLTRQAVNYIIRQAAETARLKNVHPHTLRHSCGYYLADRGTDLRTMQDYLGHRDPRHTVLYTRVSGRRFEGLWK